MNPTELVSGIVTSRADILDTLRTLNDPCVHDEAFTTPMAAAIRADNQPALDILLNHDSALEYTPQLTDSDQQRVGYQLEDGPQESLTKTEQYIGQSLQKIHWQRTPLLEACRVNNQQALKKLLAGGADATATDLLGESALSLLLEHGAEAVEPFIKHCHHVDTKYIVTRESLSRLVSEPELYTQAPSGGNMTAEALDFHFAISCALLDETTVVQLLTNGYDLSSTANELHDPLVEVVSSSMLRSYNHPEADRLTTSLTRALETPPEQWLSPPSPKLEDNELVNTRIQIIRRLADHGLPGDGRSLCWITLSMQTSRTYSQR